MIDVAEIVAKISQNLSPQGGNVIVLILGDTGEEERSEEIVPDQELGEFLWPQMGRGGTPTPEDMFWELSDGSGNFQLGDGTGDWELA